VRAFVQEQLADGASPAWEFIDRERLRTLADHVFEAAPPMPTGMEGGVRPWLRRLAYALHPRLAAETHARRSRSQIPAPALLMRALVFKDWLEGVRAAPAAIAEMPVRDAPDASLT
jgi:hypothetical protein